MQGPLLRRELIRVEVQLFLFWFKFQFVLPRLSRDGKISKCFGEKFIRRKGSEVRRLGVGGVCFAANPDAAARAGETH